MTRVYTRQETDAFGIRIREQVFTACRARGLKADPLVMALADAAEQEAARLWEHLNRLHQKQFKVETLGWDE